MRRRLRVRVRQVLSLDIRAVRHRKDSSKWHMDAYNVVLCCVQLFYKVSDDRAVTVVDAKQALPEDDYLLAMQQRRAEELAASGALSEMPVEDEDDLPPLGEGGAPPEGRQHPLRNLTQQQQQQRRREERQQGRPEPRSAAEEAASEARKRARQEKKARAKAARAELETVEQQAAAAGGASPGDGLNGDEE